VTDGRVYVEGPDGPVEVGPLAGIVAAAGGPAWEISYSDWERERYEDLDTSDEGLVVDVGDVVRAMEHDPAFARALAACPAEPAGEDISPRAGLFVGRLLDQLQSGLG
jgi:hypothetical protein